LALLSGDHVDIGRDDPPSSNPTPPPQRLDPNKSLVKDPLRTDSGQELIEPGSGELCLGQDALLPVATGRLRFSVGSEHPLPGVGGNRKKYLEKSPDGGRIRCV